MSGNEDLDEIRRLDQALDGLAAGRPPGAFDRGDAPAGIDRDPVPAPDRAPDRDPDRDTDVIGVADRDTEVVGGADELAVLAATLLAAAPAPPEGAAERGRAALLAAASSRRRLTIVRRAALLAAALALVAVPAVAAPRAEPGSPLWPVREACQEVRIALTGDVVRRAGIHFDNAEGRLSKARERLVEHADDPPDKLRERVFKEAAEAHEAAAEGLSELGSATGPAADAARARGERLLAQAEALLAGDFPDDLPAVRGDDGGGDRRGRGGGGEPEPGDDRGRGGGDDGTSGKGGTGGGSGSSGSGSSGSGSGGTSGSGRSGSGGSGGVDDRGGKG
jgi:hypothetical protein